MKNTKVIALLVLLAALSVVTFSVAAYVNNQQNNPTVESGRLTGRVFFDKNADEACEACECGIETVKIRLFEETCQGLFIQTAYSDSEGYFSFEGLEPNTYCVMSDLSPTCDGFQATTDTSQIIELGPEEDVELEWFGYDTFVDVNE